MGECVIKASNIKKDYRHFRSNHQKMQNILFGKNTGEIIPVLEDVSLEVERGDKVGIFGAQGSGKSTLMRILGGIVTPDEGSVKTNGEIRTLFNYRLGFIRTMSGRDNYEARCMIEGWSKEVIEEKEEEIFKFARLEQEKEEPISSYLAGAANRLGFAISTVNKPEILLFDEGFSFGGKKQAARCVKRLKELIEGDDTTFVMTVKDADTAGTLCKKGVVLYEGKSVFSGSFAEAREYFENYCKVRTKPNPIQKTEVVIRVKDDIDDDSVIP